MYTREAGIRVRAGRYSSYRLVDRTPSYPPLNQPSRQLVSVDMRVSVAYHAAMPAGNKAITEADIAATVDETTSIAKDVTSKAFAKISEDLVACQMTSRLNTILLIELALT